MRLHGFLLKAILASGIVGCCSGCFTWEYAADPTPAVVQRGPKRLWVPVSSDSAIVLMYPVLRNDSVIGLIENSAPGGQRLATFAQPADSVPKVAIETLNTGFWVRNTKRNAGLAIVVLSTIALGTYIQSVGP